MVELLALAHDRGCEGELAHHLSGHLDAGTLPDLAACAHALRPTPAWVPHVTVELASLASYEDLLGSMVTGEAA